MKRVECRMKVCLVGSGSDMAQTGESVDRWGARAVGGRWREGARSIYMASFFLPPGKRLAVPAAGAFFAMLEEALEVRPSGGGGCSPGGEIDGRVAMVRERLEIMEAGQICPPEVGGRA